MKKNLLILVDTIRPMIDGVSTFIHETVGYLSEKYNVTIIAPDYGEINYPNIKIIKYPVIKLSFIAYGQPRINKKVLKKEIKKADIILNHESFNPLYPSFYAIRYAKKYNKPFFTYVHSIDWELTTEAVKIPKIIKKISLLFLKLYGRWFLNKNTAVIVSFPTIKSILKKNKVKVKIERDTIGISDIFKPGISKFSIKYKIVIGYVGRISIEKGLDFLYKIFLKLTSKYKNIFLLIVGDGPARYIFKKNDDIKITGFVSQKEVAEYFKAMDIFVLPSVTEANSLSTLEAMKSGVCCVTSDVGAIKDYLKNEIDGYIFSNREKLIDILELLIKNEKLRKNMGKNARKSVITYTWKNTVKNLIDILENNS